MIWSKVEIGSRHLNPVGAAKPFYVNTQKAYLKFCKCELVIFPLFSECILMVGSMMFATFIQIFWLILFWFFYHLMILKV